MMQRGAFLPGLPVLLLFAQLSVAAPDRPLTFAADVQPLLRAKCVRCHGETTRKGGLDLRSADGLLKGGDDGPVIVPGKPDESKLYEMVHTGQMPPVKKEQLTKEQIEMIQRWIVADVPGLSTSQKPSTPAITQHDIEPLMMLRCTVCHGLRQKEGGLDLRTKSAMLKGGKSGPAIILGSPEKSLVLKKICSGEMPPNKRLIDAGVKTMSADEVDRLSKWIALGAPEVVMTADVATTKPDPLVSDEDRTFWAFRPPQAVAVPKVKTDERVLNPIDAFVLRKLEEKGMTLSPAADRLTLLRRAAFALTGLPPEAVEIERARNDKQEGWYEGLIDRLLASPRYGERWGRYWLDLAGYSDSEGKRSADPIRPNAFYYRDYVIRSFNDDKPYDRFLLEQLAGDELADYEKAPVINRQIMDNCEPTTHRGLFSDNASWTFRRLRPTVHRGDWWRRRFLFTTLGHSSAIVPHLTGSARQYQWLLRKSRKWSRKHSLSRPAAGLSRRLPVMLLAVQGRLGPPQSGVNSVGSRRHSRGSCGGGRNTLRTPRCVVGSQITLSRRVFCAWPPTAPAPMSSTLFPSDSKSLPIRCRSSVLLSWA